MFSQFLGVLLYPFASQEDGKPIGGTGERVLGTEGNLLGGREKQKWVRNQMAH